MEIPGSSHEHHNRRRHRRGKRFVRRHSFRSLYNSRAELMFERYTESARRALFFARYEASRMGTTSIETEHILLGLIREHKGLVPQILKLANVSPADIRAEIEGRAVSEPKIPSNVEIPFTADTKRALCFAAEEADRLLHSHIGPEHLLLGLLREEASVPALILTRGGLRLELVRLTIVTLLAQQPAASSDVVGVSEQIDEIKALARQLARLSPDSSEVDGLLE